MQTVPSSKFSEPYTIRSLYFNHLYQSVRFRFAGLVVFSDVEVSRRPIYCNLTAGLGECLSGDCYPIARKCDGIFDCSDGTDETACEFRYIKMFDL